ncbi:MAG: DUF2760 domain-containing protein [bacterium]
MTDTPKLGFLKRLWLVMGLEWYLLFDDGSLAWEVDRLLKGEPAPLPEAAPAPAKAAEKKPKVEPAPAKAKAPEPPRRPDYASALHLLSILQRDGRFVDFIEEDVASFSDSDVGAAARVVHDGVRKSMRQYFKLEPVRTESEGAAIQVGEDYDPVQIRLTGNVTGKLPVRGQLAHHGWRVAEVKLPTPPEGQDLAVIAPAEIEV